MEALFISVASILGPIAIAALVSFLPLWGLWNWLVPSIWGLGSISIFEPLGLVALSGFILSPVFAK